MSESNVIVFDNTGNWDMVVCDVCNCTQNFGFVSNGVEDGEQEDFRILAIVCKCGNSVSLDWSNN